MKTVAIIGGGDIGSRHLQATALLTDFVVYVVDPVVASLEAAKKRFEEVSEDSTVELVLCETIDQLPEIVDVALIATTSLVRRSVTEELLDKRKVKSLILEKFLFQNQEDYFVIADLLKRKNIPTWVNCFMRAEECFKTVKDALIVEEPVCMTLKGQGWRLATNTIHYLDLFSFFINDKPLQAINVCLENKIVKSKRADNYEFFGSLVF